MVSKRSSLLSKVAPPSIDAILDTVPAKLRPRWIGSKPAPKPVTPGVEAMKIPVCIEFASPGLMPPVYVGTSLSDPPWEPVEMEHFSNHSGEYTFRKFFAVEEGEYQYKLRLGPGDWWVCDDTQPQVDDGLGNKNNLIAVKYEAAKHLAPPTPAAHEPVAAATHEPLASANQSHAAEDEAPEIQVHPEEHASPESTSNAPLMEHERHVPQIKEPEHELHLDEHASPESTTHAPLMDHENLSPTKDRPATPPHEHQEVLHSETHSPLFAHESSGLNTPHHEEDVRHQISPLLVSIPDPPIPDEADPNDPTLEKFPTDHKGIMEHLEHTHKTLPEDETSVHGSPHPSLSTHSNSPVVLLPSVGEEEEEDDDIIAESDVPKLRFFGVDRPSEPITPPLTPKDVSETAQKAFSEHVSERAKAVVEKIPDHVKEPAASVS